MPFVAHRLFSPSKNNDLSLIPYLLLQITDNGFAISALEMFNLDRANAEEFLEIYKGVVTEYSQMVTELCSGPCLAIEVNLYPMALHDAKFRSMDCVFILALRFHNDYNMFCFLDPTVL